MQKQKGTLTFVVTELSRFQQDERRRAEASIVGTQKASFIAGRVL